MRGVPFNRGVNMEIIQESAILKPEDSITFPARGKPIDPSEFFGRKGIHPFDSFRECILPALKPVESMPERIYGVGRLKRRADDHKIRLALPKRYLASWEDIASFIEMYPNGKAGCFLFYLKGINNEIFPVDARWRRFNHRYRKWRVYDWRLVEGGGWDTGPQVLCPGNAAL